MSSSIIVKKMKRGMAYFDVIANMIQKKESRRTIMSNHPLKNEEAKALPHSDLTLTLG
jgi:hypothetical protein